MRRLIPLLTLGCLWLGGPTARAELIRLDIHQREPFAGGAAFGDVGPYEKLTGVAHFTADPRHAANRAVVDLELAPRNGDGKVEFAADVCILAPKDRARGNGALLYDVNNRGNKLALGFFNQARGGNDLTDAGNGFLMRRGYTVVWCGWIGELLPGGGRMLLAAPVATDQGQPIRGVVRYEMTTDKPAETLPLSRREGHGSYRPSEAGLRGGELTWRMRETDPRVRIPRGQWSLEEQPLSRVSAGVPGTLPQIRMRLAGGFRPGYLYELVCEAEGPIVQGLGYVAVRDLVSFLRQDDGERNPLRKGDGRPAIVRTHGFGVSQSGRFLRNFLHLGFNADEGGRRVFDGLIPMVAGGGLGFFNHRFAQPTRHNSQHEEHLYPADRFPFTYGDADDPLSGQQDGILRRTRAQGENLLPKVMHAQSAAEYWHRSGSLVHTDPLGKKDADIPPEVRVYAFGGTQHGVAAEPQRGVTENLTNPGDYRPLLRALLEAMDAWVRDGTAPPPSVYPRIDGGTLVAFDQASTGFPRLPGVRYPEVIQRPHVLDLGPDFASKGRIGREPPGVGPGYGVLVPRSDADGNDRGTLLPPEVAVPLATYTGWNLRSREAGAEGMLVSLMGSYLPFPATRAERERLGDPRPSIEERYRDYAAYREKLAATCEALVKDRYMLREDVGRTLERSAKWRDRFARQAP